jgi:hypothetical protein
MLHRVNADDKWKKSRICSAAYGLKLHAVISCRLFLDFGASETAGNGGHQVQLREMRRACVRRPPQISGLAKIDVIVLSILRWLGNGKEHDGQHDRYG